MKMTGIMKKPTVKIPALKIYSKRFRRWYDFQKYAPIGIQFIAEITKVFKGEDEVYSRDTMNGRYYATCRLLDWMIENQQEHKAFFIKLHDDYKELVVNGQTDWELVLGYFRSSVAMHKSRASNVKTIVHVNCLLRNLEIHGAAPYVEPILPFNYKPDPKESVVEKNRIDEKSKSKAIKIVKDFNLNPEDNKQLTVFIETLISEGIKITNLDTLSEKILKVLTARLDDIRSAAIEDFKKDIAIFEEGKRLLPLCDMEGKEIADQYEECYSELRKNEHNSGPNWACHKRIERLFPNNDIGKARALKYIEFRFNGIYPMMKGGIGPNGEETCNHVFLKTNLGEAINKSLFKKRFGWSPIFILHKDEGSFKLDMPKNCM